MMKAFSSLKYWLVVGLALLPAVSHAEELEVIAPGSGWVYLDDGSDQGQAWYEENFNAAGWKSGATPAGYGETGMNTTIEFGPSSSSKYITTYFRKQFVTQNPSLWRSLSIRMQRDDGVIVYINGREVRRDNLPSGDVTFETRADPTVDSKFEKVWFETTHPTSLLRAGTNTIAVEVHQSSPTSSDMRMNLEAVFTDEPPVYGIVRVGIQTSFTEAGNGVLEFERDALADPPHIELEWILDERGGRQFANTIQFGLLEFEEFGSRRDFDRIIEIPRPLRTDEEQEFIESYTQLGLYDQRMDWESEKIDTRNYTNVQFSLDMRTETTGKFESSDNIKVEFEVSSNGVDFDDVDWVSLKGGGEVPIAWTDFITAETEKQAVIPTSPTEPADGWINADFDPAGWLTGVNGVGYETGAGFEDLIGIDVRDEMRSVNTSCFIRVPFTVDVDPADFTEFQLRMKYDDGYVAYLNGTKVAEKNAPAVLGWDAEATSTHRDSLATVFEDVDLKDHLGLLVQGENILALHSLNTPVGSSDFVQLPVLRAGAPGEGIADSLDALNFGPWGTAKWTRFTTPIGLIADNVNSVRMIIDSKTNSDDEAIYFDNIRTTGDPIAADSYFAYMQLETGWDLEDVRMDPNADPDGDSYDNLLEYALGSSPTVASRETEVQGEVRELAPDIVLNRSGFITMTYRQITGELEGDPRDGYHVQDILYLPQMSYGEVDNDGEEIWFDGSAGGVPIFQRLEPFAENEDGTVDVKFSGVIPLANVKEVYVRLLVKIVGFESLAGGG